MNKSPAEILAKYLQDILTVDDPTRSNQWPIYISHMPDGDDAPGDCVAIYDTTGFLDGRYMETGQVVEHPGVQIKVRATDYGTGWAKAKEIATDFRQIRKTEVVLEGITYKVHSITSRTPILVLGVEGGTNRRELFSINFTTTLEEIQ